MKSNLIHRVVPCQGINELSPNRDFGICSQAEPRMAQAIRDMALVLVNDLILVKAVGDIVGVAVCEQELPGGTAQPGVWYEIDYDNPAVSYLTNWWKKQNIKHTFVSGGSRVTLPGVTFWNKLRDVNLAQFDSQYDFETSISNAATNLRDDLPMPGGISRESYWERNHDKTNN